MFDIGFLELLFIALIALLVLGPERLPDAIRTASLWINRIKSIFRQMKSDIESEIDVDDIKRQIHNESVMKSIEEAKNNLHDVNESLRKNSESLEFDIKDIVDNVNDKKPASDTNKQAPKADD